MDKTFKILVEKGKKEYYRVIVFKNKAELQGHYHRACVGRPELGVEAGTIQYKTVHKLPKRGRKKTLIPMLGDIIFWDKNLGPGVVAHEMDHAATFFFNKEKIPLSVHTKRHKDWHKNNERHAWMVGYLTNQFWKKYGQQPYIKERY